MINGGIIISVISFLAAMLGKSSDATSQAAPSASNNYNSNNNAASETENNGSSSTPPPVVTTPNPRESSLYFGKNLDGGKYDEFYDFDNPISELFLGVQDGLIPSTSYPEALRFRLVAPFIAVSCNNVTTQFHAQWNHLSKLNGKDIQFTTLGLMDVPAWRYAFKFNMEIFNPFKYAVTLKDLIIQNNMEFCFQQLKGYIPELTEVKSIVTLGLLNDTAVNMPRVKDALYKTERTTAYWVSDREPIPPKSSRILTIKLEMDDLNLGYILPAATTPLTTVKDPGTNVDRPAVQEGTFKEVPFTRDLAQLKLNILYRTADLSTKDFKTSLTVYGSGAPGIERNFKYWEQLYLGDNWNLLRPERDTVDNIFSKRGK